MVDRQNKNESSNSSQNSGLSHPGFMHFFALATDLMAIISDDGYLKQVNSAFEQVLGWSDEDLLAKPFVDCVLQEDRGAVQVALDNLFSDQVDEMRTQFDCRLLCQDETIKRIEWTAHLSLDGLIYASGTVRQAKDERPLREDEAAVAFAKQATELQTVAELSTVIARTLDTQQLLQNVVDMTKERFQLYHAHIYLLNETEDSLVLAAGAGDRGHTMVTKGWQIPFDHKNSLVAQAAQSAKGIIANDVRNRSDFLPNPLLPDTRSEMAIPMVVGDRLLGVLDVQSEEVDHFTDQDVRIETTLGAQIAVALQNARLFEQSEKALLELNDSYQGSANIIHAKTVQDILNVLVEYTSLSRFDQANIFFFDHPWVDTRPEFIKVEAVWEASSEPSKAPVGTQYSYDQLPVIQYLERDKPLVFYDVFKDDRADRNFQKLLESLGMRSLIAFPLVSGDQWFGFITGQSSEQLYITDDEIRQISSLASQSATIIQNRYLLLETQATLAEARQLATIVENQTDFIGVSDLEGNVLYINPAGLSMMGLPPNHDIAAMTFVDFFPAEEAAILVNDGIPNALQNNGWLTETTLLRVDAATIPVTETISVNYDSDGQPIGFIISLHDITERKRVEENLRENEERLSEALEIAKLANWKFDVVSQDLTFNDHFYSLYKTTAEQHGGYVMPAAEYAQKFVHPDDAYKIAEEIQKLIETDDPDFTSQLEYRTILANGEEGVASVRFKIEKDEQGNTVTALGILQDITERKRAEEVLRKNEERLLEASRLAKLAYWEFDFATQTLRANDQFFEILHTTAEAEGGYDMPAVEYTTKYVHPDDAHLMGEGIQAAIQSDDPTYTTDLEYRIIRANGQEGILTTQIQLEKSKDGQTTKAIGVIQDITERKQAEAERERLLSEVERTVQRYISREWKQFLSQRQDGHWRVQDQVPQLGLDMEIEGLQSIQKEVLLNNESKIVPGIQNNGHSRHTALVSPVALRGRPIGTLSLEDIDHTRNWTADEIALVEAITEQLALTIENIRLFNGTQKKAAREQLAREITDKMRAFPDVEMIVQTGLNELAAALGVSRTYVKLGEEEANKRITKEQNEQNLSSRESSETTEHHPDVNGHGEYSNGAASANGHPEILDNLPDNLGDT